MGHKRWVRHLDAKTGDEWNFTYVLPQPPEEPVKIVVLSSLQMGWVESPPYFCAATKRNCNIAMRYCKTKISTLPSHKFDDLVYADDAVGELPDTPATNKHNTCST
jgi:hypothetical protein